MKGLSIEEKAQAYDRAVEEISKLRDVLLKEGIIGEYGIINTSFERIFPEIKESEDEKIRKWIRKELESKYVVDNIVNNEMADKALAWLEKQGEPKSDIGISSTTKQELEDNLNKALEKETTESWNEFLDEQKSAWSAEDEIALNDALWCCRQAASIAKDENDMGNAWYAEEWLKSLKDRVGCEVNCTTTTNWKPSKEQFAALFDCQRYIPETNSLERKLIGELYEDLKKLKEG